MKLIMMNMIMVETTEEIEEVLDILLKSMVIILLELQKVKNGYMMVIREPNPLDILKETVHLPLMLVLRQHKPHLTVLTDPVLELDSKIMKKRLKTIGAITKIAKEDKNRYQTPGNQLRLMITMLLVDQRDTERVQPRVTVMNQVLLLGVNMAQMLNLNITMIMTKQKMIGQELKLVITGKILEIIGLIKEKLLLNLKLKH